MGFEAQEDLLTDKNSWELVQTCILLPVGLKLKIIRKARGEGMSVSGFIRRALSNDVYTNYKG